jgi:hypothetical protein
MTDDRHPTAAPGRAELSTRPAWRSRLHARAPRLIAGAAAGVLVLVGVRSLIVGAPVPSAPVTSQRNADVAALAFAEAFARAYLTWDPGSPDLQQDAVARFLVDDLDAGIDQRDRQSVLWTAALGDERVAGRLLVTVEAVTDRGPYRLVVPVQRDDRGLLAVVGYPALVGAVATELRRSAPAGTEVEDPALRTVAGRAVRNYLAGERRNLLADLDPEAVVSLPERPLEVRSVDAVEWIAPGRVVVQVTAGDGASRLVLAYELAVVRGDRWYVRLIAVNPTHPR